MNMVTNGIKIKNIKNKSFTYLFPMLGSSVTLFRNVVGCFIGDAKIGNNRIFLLHRIDDSKEYKDYIGNIKAAHKYYHSSYKIDDDFEMLTFKVSAPSEYKKFLSSQFSKFSDEYKRHIVKFHNISANSLVYKVLYKDKVLKRKMENELNVDLDEVELSTKIDLNREIFQRWMLNKLR